MIDSGLCVRVWVPACAGNMGGGCDPLISLEPQPLGRLFTNRQRTGQAGAFNAKHGDQAFDTVILGSI